MFRPDESTIMSAHCDLSQVFHKSIEYSIENGEARRE